MRKQSAAESYGLRTGVLGPVETLAQSVSAMAPSTSASLTIPLVFALAGNATWFVYLLATGSMLLVGFCVSRFARLSRFAGFALHLHRKHVATRLRRRRRVGIAARLSRHRRLGGRRSALLCNRALPAVLPLGAARHSLRWLWSVLVAGFIAYRDVKLSAEVMLWIEAVSVGLIADRAGHCCRFTSAFISTPAIPAQGVSFSSLGPALVLSIFSFVGFESATTLGGEAREPLRTIPRAVLQCALLAGVFFMLCAYSEVLGFRGESTSSQRYHQPVCTCWPQGRRLATGRGHRLRRVGQHVCVCAGLRHGCGARADAHGARADCCLPRFERTNRRHGTPGQPAAFVRSPDVRCDHRSWLLGQLPVSEMYDLLGSLSVFGFLTAYALVARASLRAPGTRSAFAHGRGHQHSHRRRHRSDRGFRSPLRLRRGSRAHSLSLSRLHRGRPRDGTQFGARHMQIVDTMWKTRPKWA